jgi:hypothetical protein
LSFVPIFHIESNQIEIFQKREERHLKKRNESSKQRDEDHHASNLSPVILDEHKKPSQQSLFDNTAVPFPRRDDTRWSTRYFKTKQLNSLKL